MGTPTKYALNTILISALAIGLWLTKGQGDDQQKQELKNKVCGYIHILSNAQVDFCNGDDYVLDAYTDELKDYIQVGDSVIKSSETRTIKTIRYRGKSKEVKLWNPI